LWGDEDPLSLPPFSFFFLFDGSEEEEEEAADLDFVSVIVVAVVFSVSIVWASVCGIGVDIAADRRGEGEEDGDVDGGERGRRGVVIGAARFWFVSCAMGRPAPNPTHNRTNTQHTPKTSTARATEQRRRAKKKT